MVGENQAIGFDPSALIEPDCVMPDQFFGRAQRPRSGALALLWAVFVDGIRTYCTEIVGGGADGLAYREAERWIFRPDSEVTTSFSNLCSLFDIDARQLRRRLLEFRECPSTELSRFFQSEAA